MKCAKKKYFGTDGIRGKVGDNIITPEFFLKLGWSIGKVLNQKYGKSKVLIGKDTRISGYILESVLEAGLSAAGVDTYMLGPIPTPAIAYLTRAFRAQAGIEISASHNPYYDNGIKIFSSDGTKLDNVTELAIEQVMQEKMCLVNANKLGRAKRISDATGRYIEFCKNSIGLKKSFYGMKIVIDCANGATYQVAPLIFAELGAEVINIGINPDGLNINKQCGSTDISTLIQTVLNYNAELGIAFDGDGDRVIMVDHNGEMVDGDELLFIISKFNFNAENLRGGIVGTVMSNGGLERCLKQIGIDFLRTEVGDKNIINLLQKKNWILGGEPSGHIVHLGITTTGDGIIAALQILNIINTRQKSLYELKSEMVKYHQIIFNIDCDDRHRFDYNTSINNSVIPKMTKQLGNNGRIVVRPSGTEPIIRIMVEGIDSNLVNKIGTNLANKIRDEITFNS